MIEHVGVGCDGLENTARMEFFCYHRDRPGSAVLREQLAEDHWSYMDGFAERLIARGPTVTEDAALATGSLHIVDLPSPADARAFAFDEPNYQAGVYRDVLLRRWSNVLGRTMWQFPGDRRSGRQFLLLGVGDPLPLHDAMDTKPNNIDDLIAYGPLLADDGITWVGAAALVRATDAVTARTVLTESSYAHIEILPWQFGGRPDS